jgi:hypothetical protein
MTKSTKSTLEVNQLYKEIFKNLRIKNRIEKKIIQSIAIHNEHRKCKTFN